MNYYRKLQLTKGMYQQWSWTMRHGVYLNSDSWISLGKIRCTYGMVIEYIHEEISLEPLLNGYGIKQTTQVKVCF